MGDVWYVHDLVDFSECKLLRLFFYENMTSELYSV